MEVIYSYEESSSACRLLWFGLCPDCIMSGCSASRPAHSVRSSGPQLLSSCRLTTRPSASAGLIMQLAGLVPPSCISDRNIAMIILYLFHSCTLLRISVSFVLNPFGEVGEL
jgi:hypothetical protein